MKLPRKKTLICWLALSWTISQAMTLGITASWTKLVSSPHYRNTKLVLESETWNQTQNISKASSVMAAMLSCSKVCESNVTCLSFNFYSTATQYVCEFLVENFCFPRQRMALQAWPGGTVWDKLQPGMTRACIDQKFENQPNTTSYCGIGRFGCRSTWPNCDTCVKTCDDCMSVYSKSGHYNCTLWPEDVFHPPIFAYCSYTSTFLIIRNFYGQGEYDPQDYLMSFRDMNRLSNLRVYKSFFFWLQASDNTEYSATYENFMIDSDGTLMNMTFKYGDDGLKIGNTPLKPSPWIETNSNSYCGSFWLLNSTQGNLATMDCPGGGVNVFGEIYTDNTTKRSGIRWPQADGKTLVFFSVIMCNY